MQTGRHACAAGPFRIWLRGGDLNPRPLGYEPNELPDCSTPRQSTDPSAGRVRPAATFVPNRSFIIADRLDASKTSAGGSPDAIRPRAGWASAGIGGRRSVTMNRRSPGRTSPSSRRASSSIAAGSLRRRCASSCSRWFVARRAAMAASSSRCSRRIRRFAGSPRSPTSAFAMRIAVARLNTSRVRCRHRQGAPSPRRTGGTSA